MAHGYRDDSRDTANRVRAMLEVIQQIMPYGTTPEQSALCREVQDTIQAALCGVKRYVRLRNEASQERK